MLVQGFFQNKEVTVEISESEVDRIYNYRKFRKNVEDFEIVVNENITDEAKKECAINNRDHIISVFSDKYEGDDFSWREGMKLAIERVLEIKYSNASN